MKMKKNMGGIDRALRILIAALLLYIGFVAEPSSSSVLHWVAIIIAVIFVITSIFGSCPIYRIFGLKTCRDCK